MNVSNGPKTVRLTGTTAGGGLINPVPRLHFSLFLDEHKGLRGLEQGSKCLSDLWKLQKCGDKSLVFEAHRM